MNEELQIRITADTSDAKKNVKSFNEELQKTSEVSGKSGKSFGKSLSGMGKATVKASAVIVGALVAVTGALIKIEKSTRAYREEQVKLNTAFLAMGGSVKKANETFKGLYRFLGDSGKAVETANHLAKLTTNTEHLSEWAKICQGVYATFGDSLPVEGLAEASNETARVGKVTGVLADALNWAGANEDDFNGKLAQCNSLSEREALIRGTLNNLYSQSAEIYERANAPMISLNEAQADLDATMGKLGKTLVPLTTSFLNLSNALMVTLAPVLQLVGELLSAVMDLITKAIVYIQKLFGGLFGGSSKSTKSIENVAQSTKKISSGFKTATETAKELKKVTAGFDELNIIQSQGSGGGSAPAGGGGFGGGMTAPSIDTSLLSESGSILEGIAIKFREIIEPLITMFQPIFEAFGALTETILGALEPLGEMLIPVFESFTTLLGDMANLIGSFVNGIVVPYVVQIIGIVQGIFEEVGKSWEKFGQPFMDGVAEFITNIGKTVQSLYDNYLKPFWDRCISPVIDIVNENIIKPIVSKVSEFIIKIGTALMDFYNNILLPIVNWINENILPVVVDVIEGCINALKPFFTTIKNIINNVMSVLSGILDFISCVFKGNWKGAWEAIRNIFRNIWNSLVNIVKAPINLIIGLVNGAMSAIEFVINKLIGALNTLSWEVPDWVPFIGGETFGFDIEEVQFGRISYLAKGGIVDKATPAIVGEAGKEAIVPLENNTEWMDKLAERLTAKQPTKIILNVDGKELGWASINSINSITQQSGSLQLSLV